MNGKVKMFDKMRGWEFAMADDGDVFIHYSDIINQDFSFTSLEDNRYYTLCTKREGHQNFDGTIKAQITRCFNGIYPENK